MVEWLSSIKEKNLNNCGKFGISIVNCRPIGDIRSCNTDSKVSYGSVYIPYAR